MLPIFHQNLLHINTATIIASLSSEDKGKLDRFILSSLCCSFIVIVRTNDPPWQKKGLVQLLLTFTFKLSMISVGSESKEYFFVY